MKRRLVAEFVFEPREDGRQHYEEAMDSLAEALVERMVGAAMGRTNGRLSRSALEEAVGGVGEKGEARCRKGKARPAAEDQVVAPQ